MVRPIPLIHETILSPIPLALGLFVSVSFLVALCAKHARQKYTPKTSDPNTALKSAKQLIATISHKAMMVNGKKSSSGEDSGAGVRRKEEEDGVWQKAILMGEKCQPPEFSGVIYYDYSGNRISEMPKSPRPPAMSPLRSFNLHKDENSMY